MKILAMLIFLFPYFSRAEALDALAAVTDPCTVNALNAAAVMAKALGTLENNSYLFSNFSPAEVSSSDPNSGANSAFEVNFSSSVAAQSGLRFRVLMFCAPGGWRNVIAVNRQ